MAVKWPKALVTEIAERRVVLFIGAGLSKAAVPDLPSWPDLLSALVQNVGAKKDQELVRRLVRNGRLLDAAELINSVTIAADRRAYLQGIFLRNPTPHSDLYKNLLDLDCKVCITTNYDQLIEKNFEHFSGAQAAYQVRTYKYRNFLADLRSPGRTILKLHGCITEPEGVILDRQSFFKAKTENPGMYDAVAALSTVNTVLFLGYSINDPDIQLILEGVHARSATDHTHFALVSRFEHPSLRNALSATYNVTFVEYPMGAHGEVPKAIAELRNLVKETRAAVGIP